MGINIRHKGAGAERDIVKVLNEIIWIVRHIHGLEQYPFDCEPVQRNPLQSAIGGADITLPLPLSIEVKRQETLSIPTWWKQCVRSAGDIEIPILLYKQNRKAWRCCMLGYFPCGQNPYMAEISFNDFKEWFEDYYKESLNL